MHYSTRDTLIWLNQLGILSDKITKLEKYLGVKGLSQSGHPVFRGGVRWNKLSTLE